MNPIDYMYLGFFSIMLYCAVLWFIVLLFNWDRVFKDPEPKEKSRITFLVPCYNEEEYLENCLKHLIGLHYPKDKLNIMIVDDGSTDNTLEIAKRYQNSHPNTVEILETEHSGKANSLNEALEKVETPLTATMDGDSYPEPDYLNKMVGYFEKREDIAGVTPAIKISDPKTIMQKLQWVEYVFQIFLRKMFSLFGAQYVFPGPGSVYKTEIMKEMGGFDEDNLTEDMELAFRARDQGYDIKNSINAHVHTEGPKSFMGLLKQRTRWYHGYLDNVEKYSHMILNPKYGNLGMFLVPINFIWIIIAMFFLFAPIYQQLKNLTRTFKDLQLLGFEISFRWQKILGKNLLEYGFLSISLYQVFHFIFLAIGILTVALALKSASEKVKLKKRKVAYFSYFFIYPLIYPLWWLTAVIHKLRAFKKKRKKFIK